MHAGFFAEWCVTNMKSDQGFQWSILDKMSFY